MLIESSGWLAGWLAVTELYDVAVLHQPRPSA
jgi:hypothetical protein